MQIADYHRRPCPSCPCWKRAPGTKRKKMSQMMDGWDTEYWYLYQDGSHFNPSQLFLQRLSSHVIWSCLLPRPRTASQDLASAQRLHISYGLPKVLINIILPTHLQKKSACTAGIWSSHYPQLQPWERMRRTGPDGSDCPSFICVCILEEGLPVRNRTPAREDKARPGYRQDGLLGVGNAGDGDAQSTVVRYTAST